MRLFHVPKVYGLLAVRLVLGCIILMILRLFQVESRSFSLSEAVKCCISAALICIGFTILVDLIMWRRILWPEFEVFWFNSVLNRSSEWGKHFHMH